MSTVGKTSAAYPILVDFLAADALELPGRVGMTFAPGKKAAGMDGAWDRQLGEDLERLRNVYQTSLLVCLLERHELERFEIASLVESARAHGMEVAELPIVDGGVPGPGDRSRVAALVARILAAAREGDTVVVHCRGGLGRSGTIVGCCLVAHGMSPDRAIAAVRSARPGAIENARQERWVREFAMAEGSSRPER